MSAIRNFFETIGRGTSSAARGQSSTEPRRTASRSGQRQSSGQNGAQQRDLTFDRRHAAPIDEVAPYAAAIRQMQNRPTHASFLGLKITWDHHHFDGPERLKPSALHDLGFAPSKARSARILRDLAALGVADDNGVLHKRIFDAGRLVTRFQELGLGGRKGLSASEQTGLRIYLSGVEEHLQRLGKDISILPVEQRPNWMFYAGIAENTYQSQLWSHHLNCYGVLDRDYLPSNGGIHFDEARGAAHYNSVFFGNGSESAVLAFFDRLEERLFPLPAYAPTAFLPPTER